MNDAEPFHNPDSKGLASTPPSVGDLSDSAIEFAMLLDSALKSGHISSEILDASPELQSIVERLLAVHEANNSLAVARLELGTTRPMRLGRYRVIEEIGRGRFGIVFRADDEQLGRTVAVKVLRPEMCAMEELRARFLHEARAMASIDHPGVVSVHDVGETDGLPYLVMPCLPGETLADWLDRRDEPIDPQAAAVLVDGVARGVAAGHAGGIIHRDLKPANIMLRDGIGGPACVLDFGLACSLEANLRDTRTSLVIGTPLYMSPEQAEGRREDIGPESDVFSLGAILYELLAGVPPFAAETFPAVLERLRSGEVEPIRSRRPDVPRDLETICLACLRPLPPDRYPSAGELADDLGRFLRSEPIAARRPTWVDRFRYWRQQPRRRREAAVLIVALNAVIALWTIVGMIGVARVDATLTRAEFHSQLILSIVVFLPIHALFIWGAIQLGRARLRPRLCRLAILVSTLLFVVSLGGATGLVYTSPWYDRNPATRVLSYTLMSALFFLQTAAWWLGKRFAPR